MRRLLTVASVVALAAGSAMCGSSHPGTNSASNLLPLESVAGPSALQARGGGSNGGGKNGGNNGGDTSGTSSIALVMVQDVNLNGLPNWNDRVTFNVSTTATTAPFVNLDCYRSGLLVLSSSVGYFDSYPWPGARIVTLSSSLWPSGAADCTAKLVDTSSTRLVVLASVSFTAGA